MSSLREFCRNLDSKYAVYIGNLEGLYVRSRGRVPWYSGGNQGAFEMYFEIKKKIDQSHLLRLQLSPNSTEEEITEASEATYQACQLVNSFASFVGSPSFPCDRVTMRRN